MDRKRAAVLGCLLALGLLGSPEGLSGQIPSLGPEFQVNTYTTGPQAYPSMASGGNGTFVVVWASDYQDSGTVGIFGQLVDSSGAKIGGEFPVNTYTTGGQVEPAVAAASNGSFVVVWVSYGQDGDSDGIFGQRFGLKPSIIPFHPPTLVRVGSEFQVNSYTTGGQAKPAVAMASGGDFVVVWESAAHDGGPGNDIFAQRFDNTGARVGGETLVDTSISFNQGDAAVAMSKGGDFVVVWDSYAQDGSDSGIFGQAFDAAGARVGTEFPANTYTTGIQADPKVAIDARGNFVVVWTSANQDGSGDGIFGQRFNSGAEKVGPEFQVNTYTSNLQYGPSVSTDGNGFVVAWTSRGQDASLYGIFAQRFDRSGRPLVAADIPVNVLSSRQRKIPKIVNTGAGLSAVWQSMDQDGSNLGIIGRTQILDPVNLSVDAQGTGPSDLNGVLEPGEAAIVAPKWSNLSTDFVVLTGNVAAVTGPAGPTYQLLDGTANYGSMPPGTVADCNDGNPGPCYAVQISGVRPAVHWDATMVEQLSAGGSQLWTLHIGDSFPDVPRSEPFYKKIETLLHNGITTGCNATQYCPSATVTRDAMAIFIAKGIAGLGELVPSKGTVSGAAYDCSSGGHSLFTDVAPTDSFCKHVHYLAAENVTLGCNATQYCPGQAITRDAMASFIAKAIVAPDGGAAVPVSYTDPTTSRSYSCISGSPNLHFSDVLVSNAFCKHIHYLWAKGIVDGCSATKYCPASTVARDAMAKFIANGFGLQLYGP